MAKFSQSVKSYVDVHQAFEAAGLNGGVVLTFATPQKAVTWAARANAYRVLLRKMNEAEGREHSCEFDHLMVKRAPGDELVRIEPRGFDFVAATIDGKRLEFNKKTIDAPVPSPREKTMEQGDIESFLRDFEEGKIK